MSVAVIIPAYNVVEYVGSAVRSVLNQTVLDWELIIVDDGSTDGTGDKCDEFAKLDHRINVIHTDNRGPSSARITGVKAAKSEYILFLDGDDFLEDTAIENLLSASKKSDADIVISRFDKIFEDGTKNIIHKEHEYVEIQRMTALKEMMSRRLYSWELVAKLFKKELFDVIDETSRMLYMEDLFANWKLFNVAEKFVLIPEITYHYFQRKSSAVYKEFNKEKISALKIVDYIDKSNTDANLQDVIDLVFIRTYTSLLCAWVKKEGVTEEVRTYIDILERKNSKLKIELPPQDIACLKFLMRVQSSSIEDIMQEFVEFLKSYANNHDHLYIYGAGRYAKVLSKIMNDSQISFEEFIVSDGESRVDSPDGYHRVEFLSDYLAQKEVKRGVIIALTDRWYEEVLPELERKGVTDYLDLRKYNYLLNV